MSNLIRRGWLGVLLATASVSASAADILFTATRPDELRVRRGENNRRELVLAELPELPLKLRETEGAIEVENGAIKAVYDKGTKLVAFFDGSGKPILREREVGKKSVAFDSPKDERLYGLGQFQDGVLDIRNQPRRLTQVNTQVSVPFVVSTRNWGLYWNNYSKIEFNPCTDPIPLVASGEGKTEVVTVTTGHGNAQEKRTSAEMDGSFEVAEDGLYAFMLDCGQSMARRQYVAIDGKTVVNNRNFWLPPTVGFQVELKAGRHTVHVGGEKNDRPLLTIRKDRDETRFVSDRAEGTDYTVYAGTPVQAIAAFRADCGGTAALPDWCWGYWHCQERFHDQAELLKAAHWFADRQIPVSVIVQDWHWWPNRTWNAMTWDTKRYPDPKGMVDECHNLGMRVMLSVWSKTSGKSKFRKACETEGALVPGTDWIDFSNPKAADLYWSWFAKNLMSTGMDAWWLDACEPENDDLAGRRIALGEGDVYRNVYSLLVNTEAYRRQRELRPDAQPLVLSRCGYAGLARTATVVWSGDVGSRWSDFRTQVIAGLGLSMASLPYWTTDAGGFFRPSRQYTDAHYHKTFIRWVQFATFCPIMRLHGYSTDMTPSRFGPKMEKLIVDQIRLREKIKPYVQATAEAAVRENGVMMTPLFDAPKEFETEYLFGKDLLVCPVTADVSEMDVWLPAGSWTNFHTGEAVEGGRTLRVKTPIDRIPVYRRR